MAWLFSGFKLLTSTDTCQGSSHWGWNMLRNNTVTWKHQLGMDTVHCSSNSRQKPWTIWKTIISFHRIWSANAGFSIPYLSSREGSGTCVLMLQLIGRFHVFFLCGVTRLILGAQVDLCDPFYKIRAHNRLRLVSRDFKRSKPGKKRTHTHIHIYI